MPPTARDFQNELDRIFVEAQQQGRSYVNVKSGDLHSRVGGYPGHDHRMPVCCEVMKRNIRSGDRILQEPPSGMGATVIIRYNLPRGRSDWGQVSPRTTSNERSGALQAALEKAKELIQQMQDDG